MSTPAKQWLKMKLNIGGDSASNTSTGFVDSKTTTKVGKYTAQLLSLVSNKKLNLKNSPPYLQGLGGYDFLIASNSFYSRNPGRDARSSQLDF